MNKLTAIAGIAAVLLAIAAALTVIPMLIVPAWLVGLGIVAGINYAEDRVTGLLLAVLVYPIVAVALSNIPQVGAHLSAIAANIGWVAAGVAATVLTMRVFNIVKSSFNTLTSKG